MINFINEWGPLIKNISTILVFIGVIWGFLKKLNKINENSSEIPQMKEDLTKVVEDLKTMKTDQANSENLITELKNNLDKHCNVDKKKQKMALDMARQCLLNEMEKAIKEGEVTVSRKAVIGELYDSYVDNGGNGAVHDLWTEFIHLKLK